jgi:phosphate starvation-inducible PhoH-like protein
VNNKKRVNKRIPNYELEELDIKNEIPTFITKKKFPFELTKNQKKVLDVIKNNRIITITGDPGTSKTFISCLSAINHYIDGENTIDKIIISKPTDVISGTGELGFLPGTLEDKIRVYAESFFDAFDDILQTKDFKHLWESRLIKFEPAQFLRGRTFKNSFIIIDEFQNFDIKSLKTIVTRISTGSKMVFLGDTRQNDINKKYVAVDVFKEILEGVEGCANFQFDRKDIVREKILIDIVDRFDEFENSGRLPQTKKNA